MRASGTLPDLNVKPVIDHGKRRLVILDSVASRNPVGQRMDLSPIYTRQAVQHATQIRIERYSILVEQAQNVMDRALRAHDRSVKAISASLRPRRPKRGHDTAEVGSA